MTTILILFVFISNLADGLTTWYIIRNGIGKETNKTYRALIEIAGNDLALAGKILFACPICYVLYLYPEAIPAAVVTAINLYATIKNLLIIIKSRKAHGRNR